MYYKAKDFPIDTLKYRCWFINHSKGYVSLDGIKKFKLKELKKIPLNFRLSFPAELYKAIDKAK